jgi:hypothetical protein
MLPFAMHSLTSRRSVFVACILALGGMAADPDGGSDAAAAEEAGVDAAAAVDATTSPADATTGGTTDASPEAAAEAAADDAATAPTGPQYVQPDGALPPYSGGNIYDLLCVADPGVTFFAYNTVKPPYADATGCKAFGTSGHTAAHSCLCDACFSLQQQCDALPGCQEIQKCGFDTGCTDANSCYLVGMKCVTPINNWGTGSVDTALSQLLEVCGQAAMPACPSQ